MDVGVKEEYAARLRQAMRAKGYVSTRASSGVDYATLADTVGVSPEMGRKYVEGHSIPRPDVQEKISRWLHVSQSWLQYGEGSMVPDAGSIDRELLKSCFQLIHQVLEAQERTLTTDREVDLALYLYNTPADRNAEGIAKILRFFM